MTKEFNKELDDSQTNVRVIERARGGRYWELLELEVDSRIKMFENRVIKYQSRGINTEQERLDFNRAIDNIDSMKWFKRLNDILVKRHQSIIERILSEVKTVYRKAESFVK